MAKPGIFITFEGGEGAGKTTQIALLAQNLRIAGHEVVVTREPGGCPEGEALRELLLHRQDLHFDAIGQALLVSAARRAHLSSVIDPALGSGKIVLCDRFFDSTIAYQGYGQHADTAVLNAVHGIATGGRQPDITFLFDIDVGKGLARALGRSKADKMESMDRDFHEALRRGYLAIAAAAPDRVIVVNADRTPEDVHLDVANTLTEKTGLAL